MINTAVKVKIKLEKGELSGYTLKDKTSTRREILASYAISKGWGNVVKRLNVLFIFNKNNHPKTAEKFRNDMKYIQKKFNPKYSSVKKSTKKRSVKRSTKKRSVKRSTKKRSVKRSTKKRSVKKSTKKRSVKRSTKKRSVKKSTKKRSKKLSIKRVTKF